MSLCKYSKYSNTKNLEKLVLASELKQLNYYGLGYTKLAKLYNMSISSIYNLIGASCLEVDKPNTKRRVYHVEYFSEIEYYVDISVLKQYPLTSHNYAKLTNFPLILAVADRRGKIVYYDLIDAKAECGYIYLAALLSAKLDKTKVIHLDIYSPRLFEELEKLGFKVCYVCKKQRLVLLGNDKTPYYQQIEHNFSNIQKYHRRLLKKVNLREFDFNTAKKLLDAVIRIYWFNDVSALKAVLLSLKLFNTVSYELKASNCYIVNQLNTKQP